MSLLLLLNTLPPSGTSGAARLLFVERLARLWAPDADAPRLWTVAWHVRAWVVNETMIYADPKDSEANENFSLDWTTNLAGDKIVASTWEVPDDLVAGSDSHSDTTTVVRLSGGTAGKRYVVKNVVTLDSGQTKTQSLLVPVN